MDQNVLFEYIKSGNLDKCLEIVNKNPGLLNMHYYGVTPLMYSIECQTEEIALEFCRFPGINLSLKDNLDSTLFEKAIEYKMFRVVEYLCQNSRKPNINDIYLDNGETYLTFAIKSGDEQTLRALVRGKIDPNLANKSNQYPIQLAIKFDRKKMVEILLQAENIYIGTMQNGYNSLLDACENDLTDICIMLIDNGADINVRDEDQKWTPLMHAICNNNEILVKKLLDHKCDLSLVDFNQNTPVHLAVLTENEFILKLLLKYSPNKDLENCENLTPLQIATLNDDERSIQLLS
ncbi:kinase D-interacting substrate of 220 kDa-like protein [Brachionus plicatilis]|uniref:Kinase D-interacting substrate of 220 kDa-like protein n=1 Tax=Brachionus plicatilis TaxID=10195 RepID=A0A3M7SJ56_BRAPC|nr:kinase D-interacting substrate of 220 kDa-like protein [Brachionus plicatilis]